VAVASTESPLPAKKPDAVRGAGRVAAIDAVYAVTDDAESFLRKAVAVHEMVGAPLFRAESEIELARLLLDAGRGAEAASLIRPARATAQERGAGLLTSACDELDR
jgi:hypothetical protein